MTQSEHLAYLDGRTMATMYVLSVVVAQRALTSQQICDLFSDTTKTMLAKADASPEGQARAKGYASLHEYLELALKA